MPVILEGIVTTISPEGSINIAPMGPQIGATMERFVLADACRYYEFRVASLDDSGQRVLIDCEVLHTARLRDFFGFNRAKHAVVEAAILATRVHLLPPDEIEAEYRKLAVIVGKTGGPQEREAFEWLQRHVARCRES